MPTAADVWRTIREEAVRASRDALLASLFHQAVLRHDGLGDAVCAVLARALATSPIPEEHLRALFAGVGRRHDLERAYAADLHAARSRDQAATGYLAILVYAKGFQALEAYRIAHALWAGGDAPKAQFLQSRGEARPVLPPRAHAPDGETGGV